MTWPVQPGVHPPTYPRLNPPAPKTGVCAKMEKSGPSGNPLTPPEFFVLLQHGCGRRPLQDSHLDSMPLPMETLQATSLPTGNSGSQQHVEG